MQELDRQHARQKEEPDWTGDEELEALPFGGLTRRRAVIVLTVLLVLVLMAVVPPLINVGHYRRQIAASVGLSLGRPVHIDNVTLNVLPLPGFTLDGFVVDEDPAFGAEPVIRAQQVRATLRINSLWRRRVEFSKISLDDPSVNLVHLPDGRWNLESILLQASRMPAAPTAQKGAGAAPRFPYIEATGARVNIKMGLEKMPLSLTEAEFALWLPEPQHWRLRLTARPARTDAPATDTGVLRVEGTLGQAAMLAAVPVDLKAEWTAAPLGAVSRFLSGADAGFRGQMTVNAAVRGTVADNTVDARLELRQLRRADFVPAHSLDADLSCAAHLTRLFHALDHLQCSLPPGPASKPDDAGLAITGDIPELRQPGSAELHAKLNAVPVSLLLSALRIASDRVSPALTAGGTLFGELACCTPSAPAHAARASAPARLPAAGALNLTGSFALSGVRLAVDGQAPFVAEAPVAQTPVDVAQAPPGSLSVAPAVSGRISGQQLSFGPLPLNLGVREPASLSLTANPEGFALSLTGPVFPERLAKLTAALPVLSDGMSPALAAPQNGPATVQTVSLTRQQSWAGAVSWGAPRPAVEPSHIRQSRQRR